MSDRARVEQLSLRLTFAESVVAKADNSRLPYDSDDSAGVIANDRRRLVAFATSSSKRIHSDLLDVRATSPPRVYLIQGGPRAVAATCGDASENSFRTSLRSPV